MKKHLFFTLMCLMALSMSAQDYVDLGLPSGTLWKEENEVGGLYTYDQAMEKFGNELPTKEQLEELKTSCRWTRTENGYKVEGPNGNSIFLPAAGFRLCDGTVYGVGSNGDYWSSSSNGSERAWSLLYDSYGGIGMCCLGYRCNSRSIRLVKKNIRK